MTGQGLARVWVRRCCTVSAHLQYQICESVWDLRKVGRARDCEWVTSGRARLGLGSQVCRAALSRCGANGDCQIPRPL